MIVKPKSRGFICTTAHPAGCAAEVEKASRLMRGIGGEGPKNVLVIGASTGYGLACRQAAAFGYGAATIGVSFERPASGSRTATAGWYNTLAFDRLAEEAGLVHESVCADAFSDETKRRVIGLVQDKLPGKLDLVIYSLAAPKRTDPATDVTWSSAIKPIGAPYHSKTVDFHTGVVSEVSVEPATDEEIEGTIKVMGGEDWLWWMRELAAADVLAPSALTVAFSYLGPEMTHPVYKDGTIGRAKEDLERKAEEITELLAPLGGRGIVSVNKALVTQASAAIPVVPLYISLLFRVMKDKGLHEGCAEQMKRMFERIYASDAASDWAKLPVDEAGRIRMDDLEMRDDVQREVMARWDRVNSDNLAELSDIQGYRDDFYTLFGFGVEGIDYEQDIQI